MSGKFTGGSYITIRLLTLPTSPSEFWAIREDHQEIIKLKKIELQNFYCNEKIVSHLEGPPKVGDLCAFREEDDKWSRVEVEFVDGEEIDVRDVDTGILLTCKSIEHLRILHSTFSNSFVGMKCRLDGVVCKSESMTWSSRAVKLFQHHLTCEQSYEAKVIGFHSGLHLIHILLPDKQDLADILVRADVADRMKTKDYNSLRKIIASKEISRFDIVEELVVPATQNNWISNDIAASEDHWICMNHIVTPNQFWVNILSDSIVKLEDLEIEMSKTYECLPVSKFIVENIGGLYAVKCKSKGIWKRASIIEIADGKATVIFVDFGETENVSVDCLFPLDVKFTTLPLQAMCCSLDLQVKSWYRQDVLYFGALTKNSFFSVKILKKLKDRVVIDFNESSVKLEMLAFCENSRCVQEDQSENVCDSVESIENFVSKYVPNNLRLEKDDTIFISFIASTSDFYVIRQNESDLSRLGNMISELSEFCSTSRNSEEYIAPGMAVASLHEGLYSRGVVLSCEGDLTHLFLVDFGKRQVVEKAEVKVIPKHLVDCLPECCIRCSLKLPNDSGDAFNKSLEIWFKENCESALFSVVCADVDGEKHVVDLMVEGEKESICTKLKNKFNCEETHLKNGLTNTDVCLKSGIEAKVDNIVTRLSGVNLVVDVPKLENNCHVQVVHINSLYDFYVQKNEEVIAEILHQLHVLLNKGLLSPCTQITVGQLVASQFEGIWFRAVIKSIKGDKVMVRFIDYGNDEEVESQQLRSFQDEILLGTPSMAWNCGLNGWSVESAGVNSYVEEFSKLCLNKVFSIENLSKQQQSSKHNLDLVDLTTSLKITDTFTEKSPINVVKINTSHSTGAVVVVDNKIIKTAPCNVSKINNLANVVPLQVGSSAMIVYIETPSSFYISENCSEELAELVQHLNEYCSENSYTHCLHNKGDVVAAIFEELWFRAKILDVLPNKRFKVQFTDYGNIEEVKAEDVQTIPESIINMSPKAAIHCKLNCKNLNWNPDDALWFKDNCESKVYKVSSISRDEKNDVYAVELLDLKDGSLLSDILMKGRNAMSKLQAGRVNVKDLGCLDLNGTIRCEVILPLSPDEFWCQHLDYMISMLPHLKFPRPSGDDSYAPCLNEICCGFHTEYSDWYRVEIKGLSNNKAHVHLIDYGEEAHLAFTHLRSLPSALTKFPPLAFQCTLDGISPLPGPTWSARGIEEFTSLVVNQMVDVTVVMKEGQVARCSVVNEKGITVSKELLYLKLAK